MAKIIIVDDDKQATNLLSKIMLLEGYESVAINDSMETVDIAASAKPDLFMLDLMMPGMNGFELCKVLRSDPRFSHLPILIVSALDDAFSKAEAFKAGANEFLTKPFLPDQLIDKVKTLLDK